MEVCFAEMDECADTLIVGFPDLVRFGYGVEETMTDMFGSTCGDSELLSWQRCPLSSKGSAVPCASRSPRLSKDQLPRR